ncbi:hypothetical protein ABTZ93_24220, partial [Streptomyces sp. NPDC097941]
HRTPRRLRLPGLQPDLLATPQEGIFMIVLRALSANTKDFGDGAAYPPPMDKDVADIADQFRLLPSMEEVVTQFATKTATDEASLRTLLDDEQTLRALIGAATNGGWLPMNGSFDCTSRYGTGRDPVITPADGWVTAGFPKVAEIEELQSYRIGEQEWCMAVLRCHFTGFVVVEGRTQWGACESTVSVLLPLDVSEPPLTLLRMERPQPVSADVYRSLHLPSKVTDETEETMFQSIRESLGMHLIPLESPWLVRPSGYEDLIVRAGMRADPVSLKVDREAPPGG